MFARLTAMTMRESASPCECIEKDFPIAESAGGTKALKMNGYKKMTMSKEALCNKGMTSAESPAHIPAKSMIYFSLTIPITAPEKKTTRMPLTRESDKIRFMTPWSNSNTTVRYSRTKDANIALEAAAMDTLNDISKKDLVRTMAVRLENESF